jgi:hypothetical protein
MEIEELPFNYGSRVVLGTTFGPVAFTFSSLGEGVPVAVSNRCTSRKAALSLCGSITELGINEQHNQTIFVEEALQGLHLPNALVINATPLVKNGTLAAMKLLALPRVIAGKDPARCATLGIARRTSTSLMLPPNAYDMPAAAAQPDFFASPTHDAMWYLEAGPGLARPPQDLLSNMRARGAKLATWVWGGSLGVIDQVALALGNGQNIGVVDGSRGIAEAICDIRLRRAIARPTSYHEAVRERIINAQLDMERIVILQHPQEMRAWLIESGIAVPA